MQDGPFGIDGKKLLQSNGSHLQIFKDLCLGSVQSKTSKKYIEYWSKSSLKFKKDGKANLNYLFGLI